VKGRYEEVETSGWERLVLVTGATLRRRKGEGRKLMAPRRRKQMNSRERLERKGGKEGDLSQRPKM